MITVANAPPGTKESLQSFASRGKTQLTVPARFYSLYKAKIGEIIDIGVQPFEEGKEARD